MAAETNPNITVLCLDVSYGLGGSVHRWFSSYLRGRTQFVRCGSSKSTPTRVLYGVPQGSVLEPILFLLYTAGLIRLIESHSLCPHLYADDTQVYGYCQPVQLQDCVTACIADVRHLDAFKSSAAEHCKNGADLVHVIQASASHSSGSTCSRR